MKRSILAISLFLFCFAVFAQQTDFTSEDSWGWFQRKTLEEQKEIIYNYVKIVNSEPVVIFQNPALEIKKNEYTIEFDQPIIIRIHYLEYEFYPEKIKYEKEVSFVNVEMLANVGMFFCGLLAGCLIGYINQ